MSQWINERVNQRIREWLSVVHIFDKRRWKVICFWFKLDDEGWKIFILKSNKNGRYIHIYLNTCRCTYSLRAPRNVDRYLGRYTHTVKDIFFIYLLFYERHVSTSIISEWNLQFSEKLQLWCIKRVSVIGT